MQKILCLLICCFIANAKSEEWHYQYRGYLAAKLSSYTEERSKNYGQQTRAQIEQDSTFTNFLEAKNQLRWNSNSLNSDLSTKSTPEKKDNFQVFLGENFLKYKSEGWIAQIGYQEVTWGEAFGFNYADIINPKDLRQTFFGNSEESKLPLLLFNTKSFYSFGDFSGSIQILYSPEPRFSKALPIDLFAGNLFSQTSISVNEEKTPMLFKMNEYGGKLSASYSGYDLALFRFSYLDRDPHYTLVSASVTNITLKEEHNHLNSSGLSLAKTIYDFVFRTDIVYTQDKSINYIENSQLKRFSTNSINTLISFDSPTYNDYSAVLIMANSNLKDIKANSFRQKQQQYVIAKLSKNLGSDKTLDLSYTHELRFDGRSIQTSLNWPVNSTLDLKFGGEFYTGNDNNSTLSKLKKINSVFFSIKNYFQL